MNIRLELFKAHMLSPQTILQNRYLILRQLGHGGMGTVYEATDQRLNITVALKETHFADIRLRKQFEREAHLLARLHHPALPKVSDHFIEDDGQYLVMHFIPGNDLWQMLKSRRVPFNLNKALGWADQLLDVLDYLHTQEPQIIHRDIKPQNLKLNERGQIILLDFGLAKGFAGEISQVITSGSIYGFTPNYAPLEQVQCEGTDPRSDLYSLAATLYHLATGKVPSDVRKRVTAWTEGQPDPLQPAHEVNPQVPRVISNILSDALAIGRSQRPASAADMRRALQEAASSLKYGEIEEVETSLETIPPTDFSKLPLERGNDSSQSITAEQPSAPELLKTVSAEPPPNFAASTHSSSLPVSTPTRWRSRPFSTLAGKLNTRSWLFWSCAGLGIAVAVFAVLLIAKRYGNDAEREAYFGIIAPPEGQILRYASGSEPETLDPQLAGGISDLRIAIALFDGLVEYSETTTAPRPSLATSWDVNADHTVWTFHLRRDAKWSDNEPLTAKDFIYSWRRMLEPDFPAYNNILLHYIKNARPYMKRLAYVYDPLTGKYATEADLQQSGKIGQITFTGVEPTSSPTKAKYLFVPIDDEEREQMFSKKSIPKQLTKDKKLIPVKRDEIGLRALDDYTIEVTLEDPAPFFIKVILNPMFRPVPRQSVEKWGDSQWARPGRIVTSGAFKLAEWIPEQRVVVERNTLFWDSANTKLDKIIFLALNKQIAVMDLYKAGDVDGTSKGLIPAKLYEQAKDKKDFVTAPLLGITYLTLKARMPPLNDVRVRRALSMAINRQSIADQAPDRQPLTGFVPLMVGYQVAKGTDYNPDEARRLLSDAGFPGGRGFPEIEILCLTSPHYKRIAEAIQTMLQQELGIKVTLTEKDVRTFFPVRQALNYKGLAIASWIGDYVDPNTYFSLFISNADPSGIDWQDPKFDEMLREANAETDPDKRAMMLRDVEKYLLDAQPIIPLFLSMNSFMRKPYVRNFEPNLLDVHDWRGVYIDHSARP